MASLMVKAPDGVKKDIAGDGRRSFCAPIQLHLQIIKARLKAQSVQVFLARPVKNQATECE